LGQRVSPPPAAQMLLFSSRWVSLVRGSCSCSLFLCLVSLLHTGRAENGKERW
ncbi:unnamed protein product, partial [Musa hybrid cultivar]